MAPVHKIALIQLHPRPLEVEQNFARAESFIRSAASQGCILAVLPEYHLTSWVPDAPNFREVCARSAPVHLSKYQALARELGICIVPGTIIEENLTPSPEDDDELHNIAYFIGTDGEILGRYQKKNLWIAERKHLVGSAHEPHVAFDTPLGRVGLLICWDLAFPEAFRELISDAREDDDEGGGKMRKGAELVIVPTFWSLKDVNKEGYELNPLGEEAFLNATVVSRAFENTCAVVFVNAGGPPEKGEETGFAGLSQVGMPHLGSVGKMGRAEGMQVVEVDMDVLRIAEENYQVRQDMRREGWHYAFTRERGGVGVGIGGDAGEGNEGEERESGSKL